MDKNTKILLLIVLVVVAALILLILPAATMIWMNEETSVVVQRADATGNTVLCMSKPCSLGCDTGPCAGLDAYCGPDGMCDVP